MGNKMCWINELRYKCYEQGLTFICPKQYFCTRDHCIMCSKPDCSTKENYESAKEVVKGYQSINNKGNENEGFRLRTASNGKRGLQILPRRSQIKTFEDGIML